MPEEEFWVSVKNSFGYCCCCFASREINHNRLTPPSDGSPFPTLPRTFDNPVLESDAADNFILEVLDTPETPWKPEIRLRFHDNEFIDIDISEDATGFASPMDGRGHVDSKSTGRESGYGRSIEESLESSSDSEFYVGVIEAKSKATYKLVVQDRTRCWFVFRRQSEFVFIQEYVRKQVGVISKDLPVGRRPKVEDLQYFVHRITSDPRVLQLPKVREFLHLDRYRSSSSSSSNNSSPIISSQPKNNIILNPKKLAPLRPPLPTRKPLGENGASNDKQALTKVSSVPLGCEEKKMLPSDFEFLSLIGKGSFGKVLLARKKEDNKVFAVKMLNKKLILRKNETAHVLSERSVLTRVLSHPYIVQLHYAFTTPSKIFFVLDYVNGGELFYHLQNERIFSEKRAKFYAAEICCALTYMHSKGIVYRDLKPENILLDREGHVVLTDFGLCKEGIETSSSRTSTFCGTPEYLAPEVILKKPYTRSVDWWTYGAVLYEMLYGLPPFYYKDTRVMYDAIIHKPLKLRPTISSSARDILYLLLQKSPLRRLGSGPKDGSEVKCHCFFSSIKWSLIEKRAVTPPFVPHVTSDEDTSNIDPVFTREPVLFPTASPTNTTPSAFENKAFRGFSYVSPINGEEGER